MLGHRLRGAASRCGAGALALALLAAPAAATDYLEAVADLPLAPGLVEDRQAAMVFDKPGGRIVEASASGRDSAPAVAAFYRETLPQLGWAREGGDAAAAAGTIRLAFTRASERLALVIVDGPGGVMVRFAIAPR